MFCAKSGFMTDGERRVRIPDAGTHLLVFIAVGYEDLAQSFWAEKDEPLNAHRTDCSDDGSVGIRPLALQDARFSLEYFAVLTPEDVAVIWATDVTQWRTPARVNKSLVKDSIDNIRYTVDDECQSVSLNVVHSLLTHDESEDHRRRDGSTQCPSLLNPVVNGRVHFWRAYIGVGKHPKLVVTTREKRKKRKEGG
jgi:hypothetical protein